MTRLNLEELLNQSNSTRYQLAKQLDVTYTTVDKLFKNQANVIKIQHVGEICNLLNCTPNDLFIIE